MSEFSDEQLVQLATDLHYVGFSTKEFRGKLIKEGWSAGDVKKALVTYVISGNNPTQEKRVQKAANPTVAREMVGWVAGKSIKKQAKEGDVITLARIAKAYAPALILIRTKVVHLLRQQIATSSPLILSDIALLGYDDTAMAHGSGDYVEKFGLLISKVGFKGVSDTDLLAKNRELAMVAKQGLDTDVELKKLLTSPPAGLTIDAALKELHKPPIAGHPQTGTSKDSKKKKEEE
jgi:hypothetical protein